MAGEQNNFECCCDIGSTPAHVREVQAQHQSPYHALLTIEQQVSIIQNKKTDFYPPARTLHHHQA